MHELLAMKFELFVKRISILMSPYKEYLENLEVFLVFAGLLNCFDTKKRWEKSVWGGGSKIPGWMYARGGGGSFRCVLSATRGVGGSKNWEKMRT